MKKTVLFITAVFILATSAFAHPVTATMASHVAATFWAQHCPGNVKAEVSPKALSFPELDQLHIFDMEGLGFVIVPADDRVMPVLAYSFDNPFPSSLNRDIAYWLHGYNDQIAEAVKNDYPQRESLLQQWGKLFLADLIYGKSANTKSDSTSDLTAVPEMLETQWDQGEPYNMYCPYDSVRHGRTVVGCVATAMAQIMKYWNYPSYGQDTHSYVPFSSSRLPRQSVDFGNTTYLWQFMPDRLENFSMTYEKDAVATISYHCGVAVDMMYGTSSVGGSGAYSECGYWTSACATEAFKLYFKYDTALYHANRYSYNEASWCALIDENLALGQPMYYSGSDSTGGHAFVLDGSDIEHRYHFNWGWSGYGDGFYTINNLAPGPNGGAGGNATYTFNQSQGAIFGIRPGQVETFDTVDYHDSICSDSRYIKFREYNLRVAEMDTLLRHLDTVFNYHLKIIDQQRMFLNSNITNVSPRVYNFCPATGYTFPECPFNKEGSTFVGWSHSRTGDDTIYYPGQTVFPQRSTSYFALWLGGVGIDEADGDNLQVSPTVTESDINLSLTGEYDATVTIVDSYGRVVIQKDIVAREAKISLSRLPAGVYNVIVTTQGGNYKTRIIKL